MKTNKAKIFLLFSLSFILGIFIASFFYPSVFKALFLYLILLLALILFFIFYKNKLAMLTTFCILIFIFGFWLTQKRIDKINSFKNSPQEIDFSGKGVVLVEPKIKETRQEIIFSPENKNYNILIQESIYQNYTYGEELQLTCKLETPKNREDSGFDYQAYLARDDIFYLCQKPKIEKTGKNQGNFFYTSIIKLKNKFSANISALIPSPESGLLEGLIIGGDDKLSKKIQDNFSRTGMTHIVAVSGYNITIVAQYLMLIGIFFGLWRQQAFWFALLGIWIFILLTGFPASAIRAGVMGTLLLYAMKNGRLANAQNAILFSAAVMLAWNPMLLRYDVGFQLSFLATIGIVYFYPLLDKYFGEKIKKYPAPVSFIIEIIFMSLSAQVFVLPIILFNFQKLSIISPLANVLILPILPLTMLLGFLTIVASFILKPLAIVFSWLVYLPLHYEVLMIGKFAQMKYASLNVKIGWVGVAIWYILMIGVVYFARKLKNRLNT